MNLWIELAGRLAEQGLWLARDRLLGARLSRRDGIANRTDEIDPRWLAQALSHDFPGIEIVSCELREGHSGTTRRERIGFEARGVDLPEDLPRTLFLKTTPRPLGTRIFAGLFGLGRTEVDFYNHVAADLPIPVPRHFCARAARNGGRFVVLLEDLVARGCRLAQGDLDRGEARAVVRCLGRLHAAFWQSPRFAADLAWLRCHENRDNVAVETLLCARANAPAIERFPDVVSEALRRRSGEIHAHREALEAYWSEGPRTLIHGDCHMGNLFFDGEQAGYFDWQVVQRGQGVRDLSYFMTQSLTTELRRSAEEELLDLYLATLREGGVDDEGVDPQWVFERYRAHSLYAWFSSSVTAATPGLQPADVARAAMQRTSAAIDDHKAFALLDEIVSRRGRGFGHRRGGRRRMEGSR